MAKGQSFGRRSTGTGIIRTGRFNDTGSPRMGPSGIGGNGGAAMNGKGTRAPSGSLSTGSSISGGSRTTRGGRIGQQPNG